MLTSGSQLKLSEYDGIYDRLIPTNHFLRKFHELVDFSFIYDELENKYCLENGRKSICLHIAEPNGHKCGHSGRKCGANGHPVLM